MRIYIATNIMGVFAFNGEKEVLKYELFKKDPEYIAKQLKRSERGEVIEEEDKIIKKLKLEGITEVIWDKKAVVEGVKTKHKPDHTGKKALREQFRTLATKLGWVHYQSELNELITKVNIEKTREKLAKQKQDAILMRVVSVLDEMEEDLNVFSEKLREWYGLHFPEALKEISSNKWLAELVSKYGDRKTLKKQDLFDLPEKSSGMDFTNKDVEAIRSFSKSLFGMFQAKNKIESYIENLAEKAIPNLTAVSGPVLASKLLALAGGLEKLAKMPSSKIQLLGAEKALFRHLKKNTKAPKYGVIFAHELIQKAPKSMRGKVARLIASKLALAARTDFFSRKDKSKKFKKELEEEYENLVEKD